MKSINKSISTRPLHGDKANMKISGSNRWNVLLQSYFQFLKGYNSSV